MAIPTKILSTLQKAGQSIFNLQRELAALAAEQSRSVQKALSNSGSAAEADAIFQEWKQSAKLAHELKNVNDRLVALYSEATNSAPAGAKSPRAKMQRIKAGSGVAATERPAVLRGNNAKLMALLEGLLNRETYVAVTQAQMAEGAALPLGSVAYSVGRLISMNRIEEGSARGSYKLL